MRCFILHFDPLILVNFCREVLWKREDGSTVESILESNDERGVLRLNSVRSAAAGTYTCEVRAESGELARRTVRLDVHSKGFTYL